MDPPTLSAHPTCDVITTQDGTTFGNSVERVSHGGATEADQGFFTCIPSDPVEIIVSDGDAEVIVQAAAVAHQPPNELTEVTRIAAECSFSVTGGPASSNPSCLVQVGWEYLYIPSPIDVEPIVFQATFLNFSDNPLLGPGPVTSARVDCNAGVVFLVPNEGRAEVPAAPGSSGSCRVDLILDGGAGPEEGTTVQRLTVIAFTSNGACSANLPCELAHPDTPFCVELFGCSDGSVGMPCDHDSQCDQASDVICGHTSLCEDGSAGAPCVDDGSCAVDQACEDAFCGIPQFP